MKKINGGYVSLFEFLVKKNFPFAKAINKKLYPVEHELSKKGYHRVNLNPRDPLFDQFIGAWQPIASMGNDFQYSFKAYESYWDILNDIAQPIRGVGNILRGLANLIGAPIAVFSFVISSYLELIRRSGTTNELFKQTLEDLMKALSWGIDGFASIIRGATQILTTPLTALIRIPLKVAITLINKGFTPLIEDEEVKRLVAKSDDFNITESSAKQIIVGLHAKYIESGRNLGGISRLDEEEAFNKAVNGNFYSRGDYINLFKKSDNSETTQFEDVNNLMYPRFKR